MLGLFKLDAYVKWIELFHWVLIKIASWLVRHLHCTHHVGWLCHFFMQQRGHQNSLEMMPTFFMLMILGGIRHPCICTGLGLLYIVARFFYFQGYSTGDPQNRLKIGLVPLCPTSLEFHLLYLYSFVFNILLWVLAIDLADVDVFCMILLGNTGSWHCWGWWYAPFPLASDLFLHEFWGTELLLLCGVPTRCWLSSSLYI